MQDEDQSRHYRMAGGEVPCSVGGEVPSSARHDVRWLAQVERICQAAPRRLMDTGRFQIEIARQSWRLLRGKRRAWPGPVAWALPAALMATMLCPPLLAQADSPIAGPEFQVNTFTTGNQTYPSVAMDGEGTSWLPGRVMARTRALGACTLSATTAAAARKGLGS